MNADFYWTFIKHTIGVLSENTIFDNADKYADLFIRNADGSLDYISDHYQNLGNTSIRGVDLNVAYRFPQSALGNFSLSVMVRTSTSLTISMKKAASTSTVWARSLTTTTRRSSATSKMRS